MALLFLNIPYLYLLGTSRSTTRLLELVVHHASKVASPKEFEPEHQLSACTSISHDSHAMTLLFLDRYYLCVSRTPLGWTIPLELVVYR